MPTDLMSLQKEEINKIYDLMGFSTSIEWSSKIHDLAGKTASAVEFRRLVKEKGVKEATRWRDEPYGDDYRKPKKK